MFKPMKEVIDAEPALPEEITEQVREVSMAAAVRFGGSVRLATGRIYTDREYEARRNRLNLAS
jgi:hypothetical protein